MRPRTGDPTGTFTADWNFVPEGNEILTVPGGNSFCSSHWDPERVDNGAIGEVRQLYYSPSRGRIPAVLTGTHHCGADAFWSDGYPADAPSVIYRAGVPTCCANRGAYSAAYALDYDVLRG